nr:inositol polyphosphate 5-phosphatase [Polyrhizophydium stewartii]
MATVSVFVDDYPTRTVVVRPPANVSSTCIVYTAQRAAGVAPGAAPARSSVVLQPAETIDFGRLRLLVPRPVFGSLGAVTVGTDVFIVLAVEAEKVGAVEGQPILRVTRAACFSLLSNKYDKVNTDPGPTNTSGVFADDQAAVVHPCQLLIKLLSSGSFYFSPSFDLTRSLDERIASAASAAAAAAAATTTATTTQATTTTDAAHPSLLDSLDFDFVWNRELIRHLLQIREQELTPQARLDFDRGGHLLPVIQGFVGLETVTAGSSAWQMGIISRLSCNRAGTRFNARGINDDGHVSNFVETEFLISNNAFRASFLQIRGSVPVFWEQTGIQVSHKITLSRGPESTQHAAQKHFEELVRQYSAVQVVNLLGQSPASGEYGLSEAYRSAVMSLTPEIKNAVTYSTFDFNAIIKRDSYERLEELIDINEAALGNFGYLVYDEQSKQPVFRQTGVMRTNCLDCLDRTNVVQTQVLRRGVAFAKRMLDLHMGRFSLRLSAYDQELWSNAFNGLWADNGDWLSRIYAGTGALKSSYTRKGKQTVFGFLDDAAKSVNRFYVSNFQDKGRQEAIDMLFDANQTTTSLIQRNPAYELAEKQLETRMSELQFAKTSQARILLGTYNLNGKLPNGESLDSWLFSSQTGSPELIILGVQELIELTPGQYISSDTNLLRLQWEAEFLSAINKRLGSRYVVLRSLHLVALGLFAFVRSDVTQYVRKVETSVIKAGWLEWSAVYMILAADTGLGGMAANKGGIGISLCFHDTTMAFVTAHFAAGTNAVEERNRDYHTISNGLRFRGRTLYDHDMIFWFGDFNYRINVSNEELREQMEFGAIFGGFNEGPVTFEPTYKYDNGSMAYDTSEKARVPSWTDRVLFKGRHIQQLDYGRGEQLMSDHRPVRAVFVAQVNEINFKAREAIRRELLNQLFTSATGTLIDLADDSASHGDPASTNPFLPSDPYLWSNPSGPLPPPSSDTTKWWDVQRVVQAQMQAQMPGAAGAPAGIAERSLLDM